MDRGGAHTARLCWAAVALLLAAGEAASGDSRAFELVLERAGPTLIQPDRGYAETIRVRLRVVHPAGHPRAGETIRDFRETARVEEWRTSIYDGLHGASRLPTTVPIRDGHAHFVLHSLARYSVIEQRQAPVPEIAVFVGERHQRLEVPQWVDEDGDDRIDWLARQVDAILARARASDIATVREAASAVTGWRQSWRRDCGGVMPQEPTVIEVGAACLDAEGMNMHRFDHDHELTATILHEARHVWVYRNPERAGLTRVFNPRRGSRSRCDADGTARCVPGFVFDAAVIRAHEADAESFAQRYKGRLE